MAVKVNNIEVISDARALNNVFNTDNCSYRDWHPSPATITTVINFATPMMILDMTGNVTFTTSNKATGATAVLILDTTASNHVPTFPSEVKFPSTPTWANNRYWTISFVCWDNSTVRATAIGFDDPATAPLVDPSFDLTGWDTQVSDSNSNFGPIASCSIFFSNEPSNNRIKVTAQHTTGSFGTVVDVTTYVNYSATLTNTTFTVRYNAGSQSCFAGGGGSQSCNSGNLSFGPLPSDDGYADGTYYSVNSTPGSTGFRWQAKRSTNDGQGTAFTTALFNTSDPDFQIKVTSDQGTFYSSGTIPVAADFVINLNSTYGVAGFTPQATPHFTELEA